MINYKLPFDYAGEPLPKGFTNDNLPVNVVEKAVKVVMKRIFCKKCGAELIRSREVLLSSPMKYQYRCEKCNTDYISVTSYPAICFVEDDNNNE